jgi:hypothetical protein
VEQKAQKLSKINSMLSKSKKKMGQGRPERNLTENKQFIIFLTVSLMMTGPIKSGIKNGDLPVSVGADSINLQFCQKTKFRPTWTILHPKTTDNGNTYKVLVKILGFNGTKRA